MTREEAQAVLDKIIGQVFGFQNPFTLEQFLQKYAFDLRLPRQVIDSTTSEPTWSQAVNASKFIAIKNAWAKEDWDKLPPREFNTAQDVVTAWNEINMTLAGRAIDSVNVAESDNVYSSENVYRSQDITGSKNILFSDGIISSEYIAASQRSHTSTYCIRVEDGRDNSNSFSVVWSHKIVNCFFIQDCTDMYECMFCSHLTNKQFCVANRQLTEADYRRVKDMVVRWILTS